MPERVTATYVATAARPKQIVRRAVLLVAVYMADLDITLGAT